MKKLIVVFCVFISSIGFSQNLEKLAKEITDEGIQLYRSEMASWYGTDVFLENYKERENIGGYFSYIENDVPKCVFFSKENKVVGTIAFPTNYKPENSKLDLKQRIFSPIEQEYFDIRQKALSRIKNDTIFKFYKNVSFNIVPVIKNDKKKVYVLSGTNANNLVLFGNDYLIDFNQKGEISKVQQLHKSLIPTQISLESGEKSQGGIHSHVVKDWLYMTPTDICTLMLYQHLTNWENYTTISKEYTSIWNCKTQKLTIMKSDEYDKMIKDEQ